MGRRKYKLRQGQKLGARSASGRKRERASEYVPPSMGVMRKRAVYGANGSPEDCCDAIGRCHLAGLINAYVSTHLPQILDIEEGVKDLLKVARNTGWLYWRAYGFPDANALARFQPQGPSRRVDPEEEKVLEGRLNAALDAVNARGRSIRRDFDALVIDIHPDHGPKFLDELIFAHRAKREADPRDYARLKQALDALALVAGY